MDFQSYDFNRRVNEITGRAIDRVEFPGGKTRDTVRLIMEDDDEIIATSRKDAVRSTRELQLLYALAAADIPAPRVLAVEEGYFLQTSVGGLRLSELLNNPIDEADKANRLSEALDGLRAAQKALENTPVGNSLEPLGADYASALYRARFPLRIARRLGLPEPNYDFETAAVIFACRDRAPIKFDARPANAILGPDNRLTWIDWDRAGRRNLADDLVSLLFDEYTTIDHETRDYLVEKHGADFRGTRSETEIQHYIRLAGVAQCCFRINLILSQLEKVGSWGDAETCLRRDRIGSARVHLIQLCEIALHVVSVLPFFNNCASMFEDLKNRSETRSAIEIAKP